MNGNQAKPDNNKDADSLSSFSDGNDEPKPRKWFHSIKELILI